MSKLTQYKIMKHKGKIATGIMTFVGTFTALISPLISDTAAQILYDMDYDTYILYLDFGLFIADLF